LRSDVDAEWANLVGGMGLNKDVTRFSPECKL